MEGIVCTIGNQPIRMQQPCSHYTVRVMGTSGISLVATMYRVGLHATNCIALISTCDYDFVHNKVSEH